MTLRIRLGNDGHLYLDGDSLEDREELQRYTGDATAMQYIQAAAFTAIARNDGQVGDWGTFEFNLDAIKPAPLWRFAWEWEWKPKTPAAPGQESELVQ